MAFDLLRVAVFGQTDPAWLDGLRTGAVSAVEADRLDVRAAESDTDLSRLLVEFRPQVVVSLGRADGFPNLMAAPLDLRRRWLHFDDPATEPWQVADAAARAYVTDVTADRFPDEPLVSVVTPTYLTGPRIERPRTSLLAQTYPNWEWVIYDDSPDDGETFAAMAALASEDPRINAHRGDRPSGSIGEVKRRAFGLARGAILVELDHDDELTPNALRWVVEAYRANPAAGFFYTDCAEVFEDGRNATYGDGWGMGFGSYRTETLNGRPYAVTNYPDINARTIRHIVGVPNHLRAWTRSSYHAIGGHSPLVHVCDDYELLLRTFLAVRMVHIRRFGYVQHLDAAGAGNAHRRRNAEIQRLTRLFMLAYNDRIHRRFLELGVDDFLWRDGGRLDWDAPNPPVVPIANLVFPPDPAPALAVASSSAGMTPFHP